MEVREPDQAAPTRAEIQSAGFLIALDPDWRVKHVSRNIGDHFADFPSMTSQPLSEFFGAAAVHSLRNQLALMRDPTGRARQFSLFFAGVPKPFDVVLHLSDGAIVLEALPAAHLEAGDPVGTVREMAAKLHSHSSLPDLLNEGAHQLRALTGFDRVTLFDSDGGRRAHDARNNHPTATLPKLSAETRLISDCNASCVEVDPPADARLVENALLRTVSDAERREIVADGAAARLTLPLRSGSKDFGTAVCLNQSARRPMLDRLVGAELLADILAMRMEICALKSSP